MLFKLSLCLLTTSYQYILLFLAPESYRIFNLSILDNEFKKFESELLIKKKFSDAKKI